MSSESVHNTEFNYDGAPIGAYVGVDDGYAGVKVAVWNPVTNEVSYGYVPSRVSRGIAVSSLGGDAIDAYVTRGETYTVSDQVGGGAMEPTRIESYPTSDINRVLVHHAMAAAGLGGKNVVMATGLPVAAYYRSGQTNSELIVEKIRSIASSIAPKTEERSLVRAIAHHQVYPQAIMAWCDYVMDEAGELIEGREHLRIGVVDVGGRTTDLAVVVHGQSGAIGIESGRSGSVDLGMLAVMDALRPMLLKRWPDVRTIADAALEQALRTRSLKIFGKHEDVGAEVDRASKDVAASLHAETQRHFGSGADLDAILYCGGGAAVLGSALSRYPHVQVLNDPVFANARGMLKYLRFVDPVTDPEKQLLAAAPPPAESNVVPVRKQAAG